WLPARGLQALLHGRGAGGGARRGRRPPRRAVVRGGAGRALEPAGELVAVDALGREDARHRAVLGGEQPAQDVLAADLAVAAALGLLDRALQALLGRRAPARLGAAAVGGEVDAARVDPDVGQ